MYYTLFYIVDDKTMLKYDSFFFIYEFFKVSKKYKHDGINLYF